MKWWSEKESDELFEAFVDTMSKNHLHPIQSFRHIILLIALVGAFVHLSECAVAQALPVIIYDDGLTRTNVGQDASIVLRDNPNPPPNPTTVILSGGFFASSVLRGRSFIYTLEDSSVLEIRDATLDGFIVGSADLYDSARLLMSGGVLSQVTQSRSPIEDPAIRAGGMSSAHISGGNVDITGATSEGPNGPGLYFYDAAALEISGGVFTSRSAPIVQADDSAQVTILDGSFTASGNPVISEFVGNILTAQESAVVDILGGTYASSIRGIEASGDAVINIHGGRFDFPLNRRTRSGFDALGNARINVFGDNFALDGTPLGPGFIPQDGTLTGVLADGSPLNVLATGRIFLIPEPATWLLAATAFAISLSRIRNARPNTSGGRRHQI